MGSQAVRATILASGIAIVGVLCALLWLVGGVIVPASGEQAWFDHFARFYFGAVFAVLVVCVVVLVAVAQFALSALSRWQDQEEYKAEPKLAAR